MSSPAPATYLTSIRDALHTIFSVHDKAILLGEDVLDPYGGAFKVTKGLSSLHPDRVLTTPISEASIVGCGIGLALRGYRPVVEIMFGDFITLIVDQLVNHAAKFGPMYGNGVTVPLVVRTPMGGGRGYGPTHSQSLEKILLGIPNLAVIAPSHFHDPGQELIRAFEDDRPVLFIENKMLYPRPLVATGRGIQVRRHFVDRYSIVVASNFEEGKNTDVVIFTYGGVSRFMEEILVSTAEDEIKLQVVFISEISAPPLDWLAEIAKDCGRVLVIEEGHEGFGWAAHIASGIYGRAYRQLHAPIQILGADIAIISANHVQETKVLVNGEKIEHAIWRVLQ